MQSSSLASQFYSTLTTFLSERLSPWSFCHQMGQIDCCLQDCTLVSTRTCAVVLRQAQSTPVHLDFGFVSVTTLPLE